jgi:molecular chaperone GrpE
VAEDRPEGEETPVVEDDGREEQRGSGADDAGAAVPETDGDAGNGAGYGGGRSEVSRRIETLKDELEKAQDMALRARAEAQNSKRRAEQEVEKARKFALERFFRSSCRWWTISSAPWRPTGGDSEELRPIAEGVELTLKSFLDALRKFNIEAIDPTGEPFDPALHQAMSMVENPDVEPNSVIAVMQKGYTLNGRLLRPAMVMVSKAAALTGRKALPAPGGGGVEGLEKDPGRTHIAAQDNVIAVAGRPQQETDNGQDHRNRPRHNEFVRRGHGRRLAARHRKRRGWSHDALHRGLHG